MATTTVTLKDGLKIGEETHLEAEIREPSGGDILDANEDGEKLVATPAGYQLVPSPTMVGAHVLRRQIVRIGTYPGPLTLAELRKLSANDLATLQHRAEALESAALEALKDRGRLGEDAG